MKSKMTYHAFNDRFDRISYIMDTIGIGEPVVTVPDPYRQDTIKILTDTGVLIVKSATTHKIITIYIASMDQAFAIYKLGTNNKRVPDGLLTRIRKNQKILKNQPKS